MNLSATITIYAGGPGSGCNPDKGKCGRPKGSGKAPESSIKHGATRQELEQNILDLKRRLKERSTKEGKWVDGKWVGKWIVRGVTRRKLRQTRKILQHEVRRMMIEERIQKRMAKGKIPQPPEEKIEKVPVEKQWVRKQFKTTEGAEYTILKAPLHREETTRQNPFKQTHPQKGQFKKAPWMGVKRKEWQSTFFKASKVGGKAGEGSTVLVRRKGNQYYIREWQTGERGALAATYVFHFKHPTPMARFLKRRYGLSAKGSLGRKWFA